MVCWLGILLGNSKQKDEFDLAYQGKLTQREREILTLIVAEKKNKEISNELFVELSTIKTHLNNIYRKTGIKTRKELILLAKSVLKKD